MMKKECREHRDDGTDETLGNLTARIRPDKFWNSYMTLTEAHDFIRKLRQPPFDDADTDYDFVHSGSGGTICSQQYSSSLQPHWPAWGLIGHQMPFGYS